MKMQKAVFICVASILSMLSPISSFATDVKIDYDRAADFGRYKKYCWQKVETRNPLLDREDQDSPEPSAGSEGVEPDGIRFRL